MSEMQFTIFGLTMFLFAVMFWQIHERLDRIERKLDRHE